MPQGVAESVRSAIDADGRLTSKRQIHITASDGTIILHGTVDSLAEYGIAQEVAESVSGVSSVDNHLKIEGEVDTGPCCPQM